MICTPDKRPQVETEKSKYAQASRAAADTEAKRRRGVSSISRIGGHAYILSVRILNDNKYQSILPSNLLHQE